MGVRLLALASALVSSGCTTVATRMAVSPPGVNRTSFRECLLDEGFYSPDALTGIARHDSDYRHAGDVRPVVPVRRIDILQASDVRFLATAAQVIRAGLMPRVAYWRYGRDPAPAGHRAGIERPYVQLPAPPPFPGPTDMPDYFPQRYAEPGQPLRPDWRLNRFLDCYVAPVGEEQGADKRPLDGDEDVEGRLLRGHVLVALLAQFGTDLVTSHASGKQVGQAERLLGHVRDAELALRSESAVMNGAHLAGGIAAGALAAAAGDGSGVDAAAASAAAPGAVAEVATIDRPGERQPELRWRSMATRLLRVFQVGVDIQLIDAQQTLDRARNLLAAFSGAGAADFLPILKDAVSGFAALQRTQIYADAGLRDARETLAVHRVGARRTPTGFRYRVEATRQGWLLWDRQLEASCHVLATVAKRENARCVPTTEQMTAADP